MAKRNGVTPLTKGMHKAVVKPMKDKWNSDDLALAQLKQDSKKVLRPKLSGKKGAFTGSPTGSNGSYK